MFRWRLFRSREFLLGVQPGGMLTTGARAFQLCTAVSAGWAFEMFERQHSFALRWRIDPFPKETTRTYPVADCITP